MTGGSDAERSPGVSGHMPAAGEWPAGDERELTEYTEPEGERDRPGAREREREQAPDPD